MNGDQLYCRPTYRYYSINDRFRAELLTANIEDNIKYVPYVTSVSVCLSVHLPELLLCDRNSSRHSSKGTYSISLHLSLADLGGARRAHATPYGTQFLRFRIHFHQKVPASEVHTPPYKKSWIRDCLYYCNIFYHGYKHVHICYVCFSTSIFSCIIPAY